MALRELARHLGKGEISPVYETAAEGFSGPDFLNLVAGYRTELPAAALITLLVEIEESMGRVRGTEKFSSRSIDIDLLTYGNEVVTVCGKHLPRQDILDYAFVLKPLADVAPQQLHAATGKSFSQHWREFASKPRHMRQVSPALIDAAC
jgi:2-amino-4-hydroxy-6-hydroxymethyldihydropteridine diphosphokinase